MLIKTKFEGYARDGIRLYPLDSDDGPAQPTSTTSTQTSIPEYAKPYVEKMLGQTEALSATPYQTYDRQRIAGFSDLQNKAFTGAQNMQTAPQLGVATDMAQQAGLRALGTNYQGGQFANQFQAPGQYDPTKVGTQSFAAPNAAEAYMSPYMQSVVEMQQREAQRQSDIAGTQRGAQAVGAGAFGGSRQAIMAAEAARNLAQQKGDIQATGSQAAYQQAQQQFNAEQAARLQAQQMSEQSRQYGAGLGMTGAQSAAQYGQAAQQMGEQSRQYGAGLGLQGLQTALQGAGQLGTLGGQQFSQGMDINKLQAAYGAQQQQQQQNILSQQYQDFQNQQNYPYKQLGFMSDMLRGLPLSQSSSQMYEAPGSIAGQIAGLGTGAIGLSKFMADGGSVNSYADGGSVDSQQNVQNIVSQLSNEQLKQALQAAQARADMDQVEAIQREMAERASMSRGLASIPMDYEAMMPDEAVGMANGGIVAFANGGDAESIAKQYTGFGLDETQKARLLAYQVEQARQEEVGRKAASSGKPYIPGYDKAPAAKPAPVAAPEAKVEEKKAAAAPAVKAAVKEAAAPASISKAVSTIAEETGTPKQTLMEQYKEIEKSLSGNNQATTDILKKAEEKLAGRAEEIKGRGLGEALMAFGFDMAAKASKPGARFLDSAAAASPTLAKSAMENQKLQMAAQDNLAKMEIDRAKYEQAMQKQDTAAATQLLAQVRQGEQHAADLAEKIAQNARTNALAKEQMGITAGYYAKAGTPEIFKIADQLKARGFEGTEKELMTEAERLKNTGITERAELASVGKIATEVKDALDKNQDYKMLGVTLIGAKTDAERAAIQGKMNAIKANTESEIRRMKGLSSSSVTAAAPQNLIRVDNQGNLIK